MISVVEHTGLDVKSKSNMATVLHEVTRQITTESKAVFLLQRYGMSKLLVALKNHSSDAELRMLIEELTQ